MSDLRTRAAATANPEVQQATDEALRNPSADTIGAAVEAAVTAQHAVPDLDESGIPAELDVPVHVAWSRVMGEVQFIGKVDQRADAGGRYNFRGIEAVLNAVGPALRKHGVVVLPTKVEPEFTQVPTSNNRVMNYCRATVEFAVIGPKGDVLPVPIVVVGEAFDTGDKSAVKAQSVALRTAYINALAIPTREPERDPEHGPQYEIATPKPPTAAEYQAEIVAETTTLDRLRTIREDLNRHPTIGNTVVQDVDGTELTLLKLLVKVGTERAAKARQQ